MTEAVDSASDTSLPASGPDAGSVNAGALLRKAREDAGMHIGALAVALKVPVAKLEALEAGHLAQLSGPVFMRALASSVCRTLKIDPTPVLALLPVAATARLHQKGDLNEPFRGEGRGVSFSAPERLLKPSILAVAALLLGAAVLLLLPNLRPLGSSAKEALTSKEAPAEAPPPETGSGTASGNPSGTAAGVPAPPPAAEAPRSAPMVTETVVPPAPRANAAPSAAPAAPPAAMNPPATPPAAPATVVANAAVAPAAAAAAAPAASGLLAFKASGQSWIEVTDAKGVVVFRKTLEAGETAEVAGTPPLKTIVGRADATEVTVRGKRMELQALAKDNVARFEVK